MLARLSQIRDWTTAGQFSIPRRALGLVAAALVAVLLLASGPGLVVNGLLLGATFALGAIGLSLVFAIMRFVHIAHGDFMTLGAYVAFFLLSVAFPRVGLSETGLGLFTFGYPFLLALPFAMLAVSAIAVAVDRLVYRSLRLRGAHVIVMTMASLGVAIAMRAVVQMVWGTQPLQYPREARQFLFLPLDISIPPDNLFLGLASVLLVVAVYLFLSRTRAGKAMRATADNPELARISGIDTERVIRWAWVLGASLAATAGSLLAVSQAQLLPILGWNVLIPIFAATILGGIGNLYGAFIGALVVGVSMEVSTQWINPSYKPAVAFTLIILVLLARPRGLFGGSSGGTH